MFMSVVQVAVEENAQHQHHNAASRPPVVIKHCFGNQMEEPPQIKGQEQHKQVQQHYHT